MVFVLKDTEFLPKKLLNELVEGFWQPLLKAVKATPELNRTLLLFMQDVGNVAHACGLAWTQHPNYTEVPLMPYALTPVVALKAKEIDDWLLGTNIPSGLFELSGQDIIDQARQNTQILLGEAGLGDDATDEALLEFAFEAICSLCDLESWDGVIAQWLN